MNGTLQVESHASFGPQLFNHLPDEVDPFCSLKTARETHVQTATPWLRSRPELLSINPLWDACDLLRVHSLSNQNRTCRLAGYDDPLHTLKAVELFSQGPPDVQAVCKAQGATGRRGLGVAPVALDDHPTSENRVAQESLPLETRLGRL